MIVETVTGPAVAPVTLAEAKAHLRVDHSDDDAFVTSLIDAARAFMESYTRQRFITQTVRVTCDTFLDLQRIPVWPVQSVTSLVYDNAAGVEVEVLANAFTHRRGQKPNQIIPAYGTQWPTHRRHVDAVRLTLVAGYGAAASDVPSDVRHAIKLVIAELYANRELAIVGLNAAEPPVTVQRLAHPHVFY